jgi:hypothetical protein
VTVPSNGHDRMGKDDEIQQFTSVRASNAQRRIVDWFSDEVHFF